MITNLLILPTVLLTSTALSDTALMQPDQSGLLVHSFSCCGYNTYYDYNSTSHWASECNFSPFGCSDSDDAVVLRWDLSEFEHAKIHSAYIDFHTYAQTCNSDSSVKFGALMGSMDTNKALSIEMDPIGEHSGSVVGDVTVSSGALALAQYEGNLGIVFETASCNLALTGKFAPTLVIDYTPGEQTCDGDVTGDNEVNVSDILVLIGAWGQANEDYDLNGSGIVDTGDILYVLDNWGGCS